MKVLIDQSFAQDVNLIHDKKLHKMLANRIEYLQKIETLSQIPQCKKMKGHTSAYRIRIADYRIGFFFENNTIILTRFLKRDKIYQYFPD